MNITEERRGDVVVLRCTGVWPDSLDDLAARIQGILSGDRLDLVIDFSGVQKPTDPLIGVALTALVKSRRAGTRLAVVRNSSWVWQRPDYEYLDELLHICDTLDDALEFLAD